MKRWPLKIKVGVYSAVLTMLTLVVAAAALMIFIYMRQIHEVDDDLRENSAELVRDLQNFRGAPVNPRHALSMKFVRYTEVAFRFGRKICVAVCWSSVSLIELLLASSTDCVAKITNVFNLRSTFSQSRILGANTGLSIKAQASSSTIMVGEPSSVNWIR